jgi:hypothetical protein
VRTYPESLVRETCFEAFLVDLGFGPGERLGVFIIGLDEVVDVGATGHAGRRQKHNPRPLAQPVFRLGGERFNEPKLLSAA